MTETVTEYTLDAIKYINGDRYINLEYNGVINDVSSFSVDQRKASYGISSLKFFRLPFSNNYFIDPFLSTYKWREPKEGEPWLLCKFQLDIETDGSIDPSTSTNIKMKLINVDRIVLTNTPYSITI